MKLFRNEEERTAYFYLLPAIILVFGFIGYPFVYSIYLSFTNAGIGKSGSFIGILNYLNLLKSSTFRQVLFNSLVFTIIAISIKMFFGMIFALIMQHLRRTGKLIKTLIMLPWVVPTSLSAIAWWWMYNPNYSIFNWIINKLGTDYRVHWLSLPKTAMLSVIIVNSWIGIPFFAISILSGLISIDIELYEAADSEGAKGYQKFIYITLPLIKPVLAVVLLFSTLMTISEFNIIYIITNGGPLFGTTLLSLYAYQQGISNGVISRGAAISIFIFPLLFIVSYSQLRMVRKSISKR